MTEIAELERRITAALDRIGAGVGRIGDGAKTQAAELEAERAAKAALENQIRANEDRQEAMLAALQGEIVSLKSLLAEVDADLQRLRAVNSDLRSSNAALREANAAGLADPDLVNEALRREVQALQALDETNRAEIDRALALLEPIAEERANA